MNHGWNKNISKVTILTIRLWKKITKMLFHAWDACTRLDVKHVRQAHFHRKKQWKSSAMKNTYCQELCLIFNVCMMVTGWKLLLFNIFTKHLLSLIFIIQNKFVKYLSSCLMHRFCNDILNLHHMWCTWNKTEQFYLMSSAQCIGL